MTEQHIHRMVHELIGDEVPHLTRAVARTLGGPLLAADPPRAMVLRLDVVRSNATGLRREVTAVGPVDVYV